MIEKFTQNEIAHILWCAEIIHSIGTGCIKQKDIDALFNPSYQDVGPLTELNTALPNQDSCYTRLFQMVHEKYPEINEAYLPFAISDLLREAYEANHGKEI